MLLDMRREALTTTIPICSNAIADVGDMLLRGRPVGNGSLKNPDGSSQKHVVAHDGTYAKTRWKNNPDVNSRFADGTRCRASQFQRGNVQCGDDQTSPAASVACS